MFLHQVISEGKQLFPPGHFNQELLVSHSIDQQWNPPPCDVPGSWHPPQTAARSFLCWPFVRLTFASMADHHMGDVVEMHRFMPGEWASRTISSYEWHLHWEGFLFSPYWEVSDHLETELPKEINRISSDFRNILVNSTAQDLGIFIYRSTLFYYSAAQTLFHSNPKTNAGRKVACSYHQCKTKNLCSYSS